MAVLHVPNAWQIKVVFTTTQDTFSNLYGLDVGALEVLTQGATDDIAAAIATAFDDNLQAVFADTCSIDRVQVTDLRTIGAAQFEASIGHAGSISGDRMPDQNAVVVTLRTALRTKAGRGRTYLAGFAEGSNSVDGTISAGAANAASNYIGDMISNLSGLSTTGDLGVISRKDPAFGFTGTIRPIVSWLVRSSVWSSQRRRRRAA